MKIERMYVGGQSQAMNEELHPVFFFGPCSVRLVHLYETWRGKVAVANENTLCTLSLAGGYTPTWGPKALCCRPETSRTQQNKNKTGFRGQIQTSPDTCSG